MMTLSDPECVRLYDKLEAITSERDRALSEALKLRLALSCILPIAEESKNPTDWQTCAHIRRMLGEPPARNCALVLAVDNEALGG